MQFVSLADTINAIAECVPLPEVREWCQPKRPVLLPPPGVDFAEEKDILPPEALLVSVFQMSKAAALLDQAFQNAAIVRPNLFSKESTGLPRKSDASQEKVDAILVEMAQTFPQFEDYWARRLSFMFNKNILTKYRPNLVVGYGGRRLPDVDERLTHLVGFDLNEIAGLLDVSNISHVLPRPQIESADSVVAQGSTEVLGPEAGEKSLPQEVVGGPEARKLLLMSGNMKQRTNMLDPLIDAAIDKVRSMNAAAVFSELKRIAEIENGPFDGLLGGVILYTDGGIKRELTKKMVASRLTRRRKRNESTR